MLAAPCSLPDKETLLRGFRQHPSIVPCSALVLSEESIYIISLCFATILLQQELQTDPSLAFPVSSLTTNAASLPPRLSRQPAKQVFASSSLPFPQIHNQPATCSARSPFLSIDSTDTPASRLSGHFLSTLLQLLAQSHYAIMCPEHPGRQATSLSLAMLFPMV